MQPTEAALGTVNRSLSDRAKSILKKMTFLTVIGVVVEIVSLYVVLSPPLWSWVGLYDKIIFFPDKNHYDVSKMIVQIEQFFHTKIEDVTFDSTNGTKLHGFFLKTPGATKVILYSHGNAGNIDYRLPCGLSLMSLGCSVLLYDYEGYGSSSGTATLANVCDDAAGAVDFLEKQKHFQAKDIVLYGESLGTGVTCELSKRRKCGGIILMSGFSSLIKAGSDKLWWLRLYPKYVFPKPDMDNLAILSLPHPPLLIVHGQKDGVLSHSYSEELSRGACSPKIFVSVPDGGHSDPVYDPLFLKSARKFIDSLD
jgi:uncharacterized protein